MVERLARIRRPAFADLRLHSHIFPTSYMAIDRELPKLIAENRPDAVVMFGLGPRMPHLRIETQARNAVTSFADATGFSQRKRTIVAKGPQRVPARLPVQRLVWAARSVRVAAKPSRDAGRYVCNYLLWRALEAATQPQGPRIAAFIHVPRTRRADVPGQRRVRRKFTAADLLRAAEAMLRAIVAVARRRR
jgi:pyroglutamyl-peptidase